MRRRLKAYLCNYFAVMALLYFPFVLLDTIAYLTRDFSIATWVLLGLTSNMLWNLIVGWQLVIVPLIISMLLWITIKQESKDDK